MWIYRCLRGLLRFAVLVFFRRIEVVGTEHVPDEGPVIFCGNHPNSLLDPILITAFCGRTVHFAAKDVLFRNGFMRFFLTRLGAVPVRRRKDHPEAENLNNEDAFAQMYRVLEDGRTIGIFPEGISHDRSQLARLKTGAARIALGASREGESSPVRIVPCGLNYIRRRRFRSNVLIHFGEPITIDEEILEEAAGDEQGTVRRLTDEIEVRLRSLTINAEDWDTLRLLDGVRRLYQPPRIGLSDRVELARRFNDVYPEVKDDPEVVALAGRIRTYLDRLDDLGLSDHELREELDVWDVTVRVARLLVTVWLWVPLAAIGAVIHLPLALLLGQVGERFSPRTDVIATTKFVTGFVAHLTIYGGATTLAWWYGGWMAGVPVLVGLPLSGYATLRVLERLYSLRRTVLTLTRIFSFRRQVKELKSEREELEAAVVRAVDRYRPEDMVPLFPRTSPDDGEAGSERSEPS